MEAAILHADLDAFYASVEQLLNPSLRGKPIAVGGGVVLAASYEAKAFGVASGMSGRRACELCPQLTFVSGHFSEYQRLGMPPSGSSAISRRSLSGFPSTKLLRTWRAARISSDRLPTLRGRSVSECGRS
jgi:impB/mucB/samB family